MIFFSYKTAYMPYKIFHDRYKQYTYLCIDLGENVRLDFLHMTVSDDSHEQGYLTSQMVNECKIRGSILQIARNLTCTKPLWRPVYCRYYISGIVTCIYIPLNSIITILKLHLHWGANIFKAHLGCDQSTAMSIISPRARIYQAAEDLSKKLHVNKPKLW